MNLRYYTLALLALCTLMGCSQKTTDTRSLAEQYYNQAPAPPCPHRILIDRSTGYEFCILDGCDYVGTVHHQ